MRKAIAMGLVAMVATACGGGAGSVVVKLTGEDAAVTGFPVTEDGTTLAFVDGWDSVVFSKVLVGVRNVALAGSDGTKAFASTDAFIVDLHGGDVELLKQEELEARRWENFSFEIAAPTAASKKLGGAADADVQRMIDQKLSHLFIGEATQHGTGTKYAFELALAVPNANSQCTDGDDGKQGVVVTASAIAEASITLHLDHLFWDNLAAHNGTLRFTAIAAAGGEDKRTTTAELATQSLDAPKGLDGQPLKDEAGTPLVYVPGSAALPSNDLAGFIAANARLMAHLNGEGLCTTKAISQ